MAMNDNPEQNLEQWAEKGGPPSLKAGLGGLFPTPAVSRFRDEQILAAARQQLSRRNRMRWVIRYAVGSVAAAAVILIAIKTTHVTHREQASFEADRTVASAEDVNRDGKLDILDAYFMARKVAANETLSKEWDFNRDGAVDNKDVDVVAFSAVKIKPEGAQ